MTWHEVSVCDEMASVWWVCSVRSVHCTVAVDGSPCNAMDFVATDGSCRTSLMGTIDGESPDVGSLLGTASVVVIRDDVHGPAYDAVLVAVEGC